MSLLYDETQTAILEEAQKVLKSHVTNEALLSFIEPTGKYDKDLWEIAKNQGWTAIAIEEEFGGLGLGLTEVGLVAQAMGESCVALPFLSSSYALISALTQFGGAVQKAAYLEKIAAGELTATFGFAQKQNPIAKPSPLLISNGQITGRLEAVVSGLAANIALVLANDSEGLALAIVDLDQAAVTREAVNSYDNSRLMANINFANAKCDILISGDMVMGIAKQLLAEVAVIVAHEQMGGAKVMMEKSREYAVDRKAFGQPIGAFQSVKHRIAEIYGLVELARASAIFAASRVGEDDFLIAAAAARLSSTEAYDTASRDCIQIHGGIGVTWEGGLHLHQRRTRSLANELGNMIFWEDVLVDGLREQNNGK